MRRSTQWLLATAAIVTMWAVYDPFPASASSTSSTKKKPAKPGGSSASSGSSKKRPSVALPPGKDKRGSLTTPKAKRGAQAPRTAAKMPPASQGTLTTPTKQSAAKKRAQKPVPRGASLTAPSKPGS